MKVAILIDGAFFLIRANHFGGKDSSPESRAALLYKYCQCHIRHLQSKHRDTSLYRIFFYDCPPPLLSMHHPITGEFIKFGESENAKWRYAFQEALKKQRKVALRLGSVDTKNSSWRFNGDTVKKICAGKVTKESLTEKDVLPDIKQKGVDMRIGLDIASMSFKNQVDQMILISGDSDFVPAAKLARREGVDFNLDPMGQKIKSDLFEHIDGLWTPAQEGGKMLYELKTSKKGRTNLRNHKPLNA